MYLKLREDVSYRIHGDDLELHGKNGVRLKGVGMLLEKSVARLESGVACDYEFQAFERKLLSLLDKRGLLIRTSCLEDRNTVWQSHFPVKEPLSAKSVLIIGCGGTGAIVADHLARAGVGELGLVDGASLDLPDLNRQFTYRRKDIGKPKVELLKKHIEDETNTRVKEAHDFYLNKRNLELLRGSYDLVVNCADRPKFEIQELVLELAERMGCPAMFGSVGITDYIVGPLVAEQRQKRRFLDQLEKEKQLFRESSKVIKGSNALLNTQAAIAIAIKCFEYLSGIDDLAFTELSALNFV